MTRRFLAIYLQDHRAGAAVGAELSRRIRRATEGTPLGAAMEAIVVAIDEDVETLDRLMDEFDVGKDRLKMAAGWSGEKLGRLKLNGRVLSASPLSRVVELEMLGLGIDGKHGMWLALDATIGADLPDFDFKALAARAVDQRAVVEKFRLEAVRASFAEEPART